MDTGNDRSRNGLPFLATHFDRGDFRAGVVDAIPLLLGGIPFGLVMGVAAARVGLSFAQTVMMSMLVFAGTSQLAAVDLLADGAPITMVILTAAVINLRMSMYSTSLAPHFAQYRDRWKALLSFVLMDLNYAQSIARYAEDEETDRRAYYLGVTAPLWLVWVLSTAAGVLLGASIPPGWNLSFAVPLIFLSLFIPTLTDRPSVLAGATSGIVAVLGAGLPYQANILVAAVAGVAVGMLTDPTELAEVEL